jgi:nicotinate-nucleotide adenylyltransferase
MLDLRTCRRLLVYGGTFDPPHRAHVQLPREAAKRIGADGVLYIPAGQPPHKPSDDRTPGEHRLAMLQLALADVEDAAIDPRELERQGPSYTVNTLEALREELGDGVEMRLLIGADMARIFDKWYESKRVAELAEPVVMLRPPDRAENLVAWITDDPAEQAVWRSRLVETPQIDVSSSMLRRRIAEAGVEDEMVKEMLAELVRRYIAEHGLYGCT